MTVKELGQRVRKLGPRRMTVLAELPDGEAREMSVHEMIDAGAGFLRAVDGNDLEDLDRILAHVLPAECARSEG